jgi:hypothetical protein
MKKLLLLTAIITSHLEAQIPNSGFETWVNTTGGSQTYQEPQGWISADPLENLFNPSYTGTSVVQTSQSHSGTKAALLQTAVSGGDTVGGFLLSTASIATLFNNNAVPGFPCTTRPTNFQVYYKFNPVGGDQAGFLVMLSKWNSGTNQRDTIAIGESIISGAMSSYSLLSVPITYSLNLFPDTAMIEAVLVSGSSTTHVGSQLYLDDFGFTGSAPFGIEGFARAGEMQLSPNPSSGLLRIESEGEIGDVQICNNLGELVRTERLTGVSALMDIGTLPPGVYTVRARGITRKLIKE